MNLDQPVHQDSARVVCEGPGQLSAGEGVPILISLLGWKETSPVILA